jgi:uncharacterized protein YjiS (DUF1127 family)
MAPFFGQNAPVHALISRPPIGLGALASVADLPTGFVRTRMRMRRDRRQLAGLSERMLADLGLSRFDIA